jgi:hypothetical protein
VEHLISPDVGDVVFNLSHGGVQWIYRRMRVVKVTATQIHTIDLTKRCSRYWRKGGRAVGNHTNHLCLLEPSAPAFEAKHQVGKPLPELEVA